LHGVLKRELVGVSNGLCNAKKHECENILNKKERVVAQSWNIWELLLQERLH